MLMKNKFKESAKFFSVNYRKNIFSLNTSLNFLNNKNYSFFHEIGIVNNSFTRLQKFSSKYFALKKLPNLKKYGEVKFNFKSLLNDLPVHISNIKNRKVNADAENVLALYHKYVQKVDDINLMRRQLNEMKSLSRDYAKSGKSFDQLSKDQKKHINDIAKFQEELVNIEEELMTQALKIPNETHPDVPIGDESKSKILKVVGKQREFDFEPLDHLELGKKYDLFDFDNAAKITDSKFVLLKNEAALLEQALINYGINKIIKKGFTFMTTPDICKNTIIEGCGFNPRDDSSTSILFRV